VSKFLNHKEFDDMTTESNDKNQSVLSRPEMVVNLEYQLLEAAIFSMRFHDQQRVGDTEAIIKALTCKYQILYSELSDGQRNRLYSEAREALAAVRRNKGGGVLPQG
jgi:hypothetical protein